MIPYIIAITLQTLAECEYPSPDIAEQVETKGCQAFMLPRLYRYIIIAIVILMSHYFQQYLYSVIYIEKELQIRQQGQLKDFFTAQI